MRSVWTTWTLSTKETDGKKASSVPWQWFLFSLKDIYININIVAKSLVVKKIFVKTTIKTMKNRSNLSPSSTSTRPCWCVWKPLCRRFCEVQSLTRHHQRCRTCSCARLAKPNTGSSASSELQGILDDFDFTKAILSCFPLSFFPIPTTYQHNWPNKQGPTAGNQRNSRHPGETSWWHVRRRCCDESAGGRYDPIKASSKKLLSNIKSFGPGSRFCEWSQAVWDMQRDFLLEVEGTTKWDMHFMGIYNDCDGHFMDANKDLITGRAMSQWWDQASESGPPSRQVEPFGIEPPALDVLTIDGDCVKQLSYSWFQCPKSWYETIPQSYYIVWDCYDSHFQGFPSCCSKSIPAPTVKLSARWRTRSLRPLVLQRHSKWPWARPIPQQGQLATPAVLWQAQSGMEMALWIGEGLWISQLFWWPTLMPATRDLT